MIRQWTAGRHNRDSVPNMLEGVASSAVADIYHNTQSVVDVTVYTHLNESPSEASKHDEDTLRRLGALS